MSTPNLLTTPFENLALNPVQYLEQTAEIANVTAPFNPEWHLYANLSMQLTVAINLQDLAVAYLEQLQVGTILSSQWPASDDVSMFVDGVFLANVCFEPAGRNLAVRISDFTVRGPSVSSRAPFLAQPSKEPGTSQELLNALRVSTSLRFGFAQAELGSISRLTIGQTIVLNRPVNAPVDIIARGYVVAAGSLVLVGGCYAVQITRSAHAAWDLAPS